MVAAIDRRGINDNRSCEYCAENLPTLRQCPKETECRGECDGDMTAGENARRNVAAVKQPYVYSSPDTICVRQVLRRERQARRHRREIGKKRVREQRSRKKRGQKAIDAFA